MLGICLAVSLSNAFQALPRAPSANRRATRRLRSMPMLEDWKILPNGRVEGKVANHPEIEDGWVISTSPLTSNVEEEVALGKEVIFVETMTGSQYLLVNRNKAGIAEEVSQSNSFFPSPMDTTAEGSSMPLDVSINSTYQKSEEEKMSETKKLMQQVKDAGIAGVISYALWELGFWAVSVPVCIAAYSQVTGHWPDFSNQEDLQQLGAEAFAFVNVARFAVPLRIGLALGTTPWIQKNLVDRFQKPSSPDGQQDENNGTGNY